MWGGRVAKPLSDFLKKHIDLDVYIFQEIYKSNSNTEQPEEKGRLGYQKFS